MATGRDYPLGAAISTVRDGLSARAGLRAFRDGGGRTTDSTWFRMVAETRRTLSDRLDEPSRPLGRRPTGDEVTVMSTQRRSGYWQQVEVFYRDRATGEVSSAPFVLRGDALMTRQGVLDFALSEWEAGESGTPNPDGNQVLGAAYVSTLELQPAASPPMPTVTQAAMTPPVSRETSRAPRAPRAPAQPRRRRAEPTPARAPHRGTNRVDEVVRDAAQILELRPGPIEFDDMAARIATRQGFHGAPEVAPAGRLDAAIAAGWREVWRGYRDAYSSRQTGVTGAVLAERMRTGAYEPGMGVYGNGFYTSVRRATAEVYLANQYTAAGRAGLMRMAINPRARIIDLEEVRALQRGDPRVRATIEGGRVLYDEGRYAAALGYDAIRVRGATAAREAGDGAFYPPGEAMADQYVVLNRTVLMIQPEGGLSWS